MPADRILVTGAAGFTGRHFIRQASEKGYQCVALSQKPGRDIAGASSVLMADLTDRKVLDAAVSEAAPDYVVHLAAVSFVAHEDLRELYLSNVVGTVNLLQSLHLHAPGLRRILIASSGNVYGDAAQLPISEDTPFSPQNDYSVSKCSMELAVRLRMAKLPIIMVRPFNYTGRGQAEHFLIPKITEAFRQRRSGLELGNLNISRDFSDVRDVVSAYLSLLESEATSEVFNVCSGRAVSLQEILNVVRQLSGHDLDVRVNPGFVREKDIQVLYGSDARLKELIGEYRQYRLEDTLSWMLNKD